MRLCANLCKGQRQIGFTNVGYTALGALCLVRGTWTSRERVEELLAPKFRELCALAGRPRLTRRAAASGTFS